MAILQKIQDIRDNLVIEKTGYDERNDFYYFKADDVAAGVRKALIEHGVIHRTRIVEHKVENIVDKQGRVRPAASGVVEVIFTDPEDGSEFATQAVASGSDIGGDKATRKMAVQAFKIVAIDIFTVVEGMGGFDSDRDAQQPSLNEGAEEEKVEASPVADAKQLGKMMTDLINDPDLDAITGEVALTVGRRIAAEVLGETPVDRVWRKDPRVLEPLVKALQNGELE